MSQPEIQPPTRLSRLAPLALLLAVALAYANSLHGPFVFDDLPAIRDNASLESFGKALHPPSADGNTVGGRPLLNLSFALNRAVTGKGVLGFHAFNLLIHAAAALLLHAVLRRILLARAVAHALVIAFAAALLWAVHPLTTAAVTYIVQRAESLAALFTLAALYCFLRGASGSKAWLAGSTVAAWLGVATKETAAVAPLLILLLDATLGKGGFIAALRARPAYYASLAAGWVLLAALVASADGRGGSAGFGGPIDSSTYLATQCRAIAHYLRLAAWPDPLVFDYGSPTFSWGKAAPFAVMLVLLFAGSAWALRQCRLVGAAGMAFFLLLAPSSSILPIATQTIGEHRMYLPLAALIALADGAAVRLGGRTAVIALLGLALPLGWATHRRNADYRTAEELWNGTVAKRPENPRARNNLGLLLAERGQNEAALPHLAEAVRLVPENPEALNNLGNVLQRLGRSTEALPHLEHALRLAPGNVRTRVSYATALYQAGRPDDAAQHFAEAARSGPLDPDAAANHGAALLASRRPAEATDVLRRAVAADPGNARAHYNLGNALAGQREWDGAIASYRAALAIQPDHLPAQANLGNALLSSGRAAEAVPAFERALQLHPGDPRLEASLAQARALAGRR